MDDPELELAVREAGAAWDAYSAPSDYEEPLERFGRALRLATEARRQDKLESLSRVRILDATKDTVEMRILPGSHFAVIDLGFGPFDPGRDN